MGQRYRIANLDKKQYIDPSFFGEGSKFMEFMFGTWGTTFALGLLICKDNGLGFGDFYVKHDNGLVSEEYPVVGSWYGDRIVSLGDYGDQKLNEEIDKKFNNISNDIMSVMKLCPEYKT